MARISDLGTDVKKTQCPNFVLATHAKALRSDTHKRSGHRHI